MSEIYVTRGELTDGMIRVGAALLGKLDREVRVTSAFWLFDPELQEWRLHFASPDVNDQASGRFYDKIGRAINELGPDGAAIPFSAIAVVDVNSEVVRNLSRAFRTDMGISDIRLQNCTFGGYVVEDALLYRVANLANPPPPPPRAMRVGRTR